MKWWKVALLPSIRKRAIKIAFIVGIILMGINHGDKILYGTLSSMDTFKIVLTFFVPYAVATYSAVRTWYEGQRELLPSREHQSS